MIKLELCQHEQQIIQHAHSTREKNMPLYTPLNHVSVFSCISYQMKLKTMKSLKVTRSQISSSVSDYLVPSTHTQHLQLPQQQSPTLMWSDNHKYSSTCLQGVNIRVAYWQSLKIYIRLLNTSPRYINSLYISLSDTKLHSRALQAYHHGKYADKVMMC